MVEPISSKAAEHHKEDVKQVDSADIKKIAAELRISPKKIVDAKRKGGMIIALVLASSHDSLVDQLSEQDEETLDKLEPEYELCDFSTTCIHGVLKKRELTCEVIGCKSWVLVELKQVDSEYVFAKKNQPLPAMMTLSSSDKLNSHLRIKDIDNDTHQEAMVTVAWSGFGQLGGYHDYSATFLIDLETWSSQGAILRYEEEDIPGGEGSPSRLNLRTQHIEFKDINKDDHLDILLQDNIGQGSCFRSAEGGDPLPTGDDEDPPGRRCEVTRHSKTCVYDLPSDSYRCTDVRGTRSKLALPESVQQSFDLRM